MEGKERSKKEADLTSKGLMKEVVSGSHSTSRPRLLPRRVLRTHIDKLGLGGQIRPEVCDCSAYEQRTLFTFLKS